MNIKEILDKHKKWLNGEAGGERANLSEADLSRANLSGADLRGANLSEADLSGADLSWADLSGADLRGANLSRANLRGANLSRADLSGADLSRANLSEADLSRANLSRANLSGADLSGADLSGADLSWADLSGANLSGADLSGANLSEADLSRANLRGAKNTDSVTWNIYTAFYPLQCPEKGAYTAFKKASGLIVELEIPADAMRSSATSRKCRASKAIVLSITDIEGNPAGDSVPSDYDPDFMYRVGETVSVDSFDANRWNECAPGIHHFITRGEAVRYE